MRKIILTQKELDGEMVMMVLDCEIEIDDDGDYKTIKIYRERTATPKEILLYFGGWGRFIDF